MGGKSKVGVKAGNPRKGAKGAKKEKDVAIATATEALHVLGALKGSLASVEEPTASKIVDATIEITSLGEPLLETHATETLLALSMSPNPGCDAKTFMKILEPAARLAREASLGDFGKSVVWQSFCGRWSRRSLAGGS